VLTRAWLQQHTSELGSDLHSQFGCAIYLHYL
jgi:hypothetical protein